MKAQMHTTPSSMPVQARTPKSAPLSMARKNSTGPVSHGSPISSAPIVGPHQRAASETTATRIGDTAILRRRSIGDRDGAARDAQ
jgi:hypothetical protein